MAFLLTLGPFLILLFNNVVWQNDSRIDQRFVDKRVTSLGSPAIFTDYIETMNGDEIFDEHLIRDTPILVLLFLPTRLFYFPVSHAPKQTDPTWMQESQRRIVGSQIIYALGNILVSPTTPLTHRCYTKARFHIYSCS